MIEIRLSSLRHAPSFLVAESTRICLLVPCDFSHNYRHRFRCEDRERERQTKKHVRKKQKLANYFLVSIINYESCRVAGGLRRQSCRSSFTSESIDGKKNKKKIRDFWAVMQFSVTLAPARVLSGSRVFLLSSHHVLVNEKLGIFLCRVYSVVLESPPHQL